MNAPNVAVTFANIFLNDKENLLEGKVTTLHIFSTTLKTTSQQNINLVEALHTQTFHDKQH